MIPPNFSVLALVASLAIPAAVAGPPAAEAEPRAGTAVRSAHTSSGGAAPWRLARGWGRDYDFIARLHGRPARWNPCKVITYRINPGGMSRRDVREVRQAFGKVAAASGLRFRYSGRTSYVWSRAGRHAAPGDADFIFSFATPGRGRGQSDLLTSDTTVGVGGPAWKEDGRTLRIVRGSVVMNSDILRRLPRGTGPGARMGAYLHEIGHAVGLDHADGRQQLMYPVLQTDVPPVFGAGDRAGLRRLGRSAGCLD